uniref:Thioredoxin domain-containing protein n=1 Tax=Ananas comosus var. bracteatus TaxID=296719 RepID=A0A6V7NJT5_ANACO|nr:unnamed protein product [Ananas comosus var. bracteatus]
MASTISSSLYTTPSYLPFSLNQSPSPSLSPSASKFSVLSKRRQFSIRLRPRASASSQKTPPPGAAAAGAVSGDERLRQVHSIAEFEEALRSAKNRLVVVEYAASHSANSQRMYPFVVELSRACGDVDFLLVHDEEGIGPDQLAGDVLYYGDSHSAVVQLHSRADADRLIDDHRGPAGKLLVLDVGLKHCGPCVKVYPTVVKLSRSMADTTVFARMNGDENESCMEFLKAMDVVEVPTFLFIRDGKICGRYVGSGKGELIGEILRYQGVKVT